MVKVGVGVIGVGGWGKNHVRVYSQLSRYCSLLAICDLDSKKAKAYGKNYGVDAYTDVNDLLARKDINCLSICTPSGTHYEITLEALKSGKNILVEKPITLKPGEGAAICREAIKRGLKLTVGFLERFNPCVQRLRTLLKNDKLGEIHYMSAGRISPSIPRAGGIGVLLDLAIHDIDIIRYLLGENPVEVYAEEGTSLQQINSNREAIDVEIVLSFPSGVDAHIVARRLKPASKHVRKIQQLHVVGTGGFAVISYIPQILWRFRPTEILRPFLDEKGKPRFQIDPTIVYTHKPVNWEEPLKLELRSFVQAVRCNRQPEPSGEDGLRALEIADAAMKSIRSGRPKRVKYLPM
jgi:UDP-N-acetylglucosamine 3-dehydrogenase